MFDGLKEFNIDIVREPEPYICTCRWGSTQRYITRNPIQIVKTLKGSYEGTVLNRYLEDHVLDIFISSSNFGIISKCLNGTLKRNQNLQTFAIMMILISQKCTLFQNSTDHNHLDLHYIVKIVH
jgi:hypothetical protein